MGERCIRNGDKQSSDKLDKRHFKAAYTGCGFVYQSNKGIAYSGGKPEENPFYRGQSAHLNACYNKHSGDRRRHAEDLYFSRVFPEKEYRSDHHDDRRHIVCKGRDTDVDPAVGLKQSDPVGAHEHARKDKAKGILFIRADKWLYCFFTAADKKNTSQKQESYQRSPHDYFGAAVRDFADKNRQSTPDEHCGYNFCI